MNNNSGTHEAELARRLVGAFETGSVLPDLPQALVPPSAESAYAVQFEIVKQLKSGIGGWKVGSKSSTGPVQGAPLPSAGVHRSPAALRLNSFSRAGLELEIAFYFGREFLPSQHPYSNEEVLEGVKFVAATIEIVSSRFAQWPQIDKLGQLADLQNHGALVVGQLVEYQEAYPFMAPRMKFSYEGMNIAKDPISNPGGDPRRLLGWLVNHCTSQGLTLTEKTVVTTGSYTGVYFPNGAGTALGEIAGLPAVSLTLT